MCALQDHVAAADGVPGHYQLETVYVAEDAWNGKEVSVALIMLSFGASRRICEDLVVRTRNCNTREMGIGMVGKIDLVISKERILG